MPDGPTEHGLVDRLTALKWRKQRLDRYEHLSLQQQVDQIDHKNEVNRHRTNLKNLGPEFAAAASVEVVEEILSRLSPSYYRDIITRWVPREKCQDQSQWGQAISAYLSRVTTEDQVEGIAKFVAIVNPDSLEKELARADRIDEAIDRTIKRLMQVKTAKHVFPNMRKNAKADPMQINLPVPTNSNLQGCKSEQNVRLLDKVEISAKRDLKGA